MAGRNKSDEIVETLENGLTFLCRRAGIAPVVSVQMTIKTGSIYEQEHLGTGISHLFEHLLHGGTTERREEKENEALLDQLGNNNNASTWKSWTRYYINTSSDNLDQAVDLLADFITRPKFPEDEFEREWGVVQRELEQHVNNPPRQLNNLAMETIYKVHPMRFPVIGHKQALQELKRDDIINYYKRMYVPDNVIVSIAGQIDPDEALQSVKTHFADFSRRPVVNIALPYEPIQASPRAAVKYMNTNVAWVTLAYPTIRLTHPDLYALDVLSYLLTRGRSSPLFHRAVEEEQAALTISSSSFTPSFVRGIFSFNFQCDPERVEDVLRITREEIARVIEGPISDDMLERVKRQKLAEHVFSRETPDEVAFSLALDYLSTGDPDFSSAYVEGIKQVTVDQVKKAARRYFVPERENLIKILPKPSKPDGGESPQDAVSVGELTTFTLDNGLQVLLRTNRNIPTVSMQLYFKGGVIADPDGKSGVGNASAAMALRGTPSRTHNEIQAFFDQRGGGIRGSGGNNTIFITSSMLKEDFEEGAAVFADSVINPSFPSAEWERYRPELENRIRRMKDRWTGECFLFFRKQFFKRSPFRNVSAGLIESIRSLTVDEIESHYRRLAVGANGVLSVFGDIDPNTAKKIVSRLFGPLPSGSRYSAIIPQEEAIEQEVAYVSPSRHKETAGVFIGFRGTTFLDLEDRPPLMVLDTIMGGYGYPRGWLHNSLRGSGGRSLVYAAHTQNFYGHEPGWVGFVAGCQPEKVAEVHEIVSGLVDRARKGGFTQEELEVAKKIIRSSETLSQQTNSDLAAITATNVLFDLGWDFHERMLELIDNVDLADVKRVAVKYLTKPIVAITAGDVDPIKLPIKTVHVEAKDD
jgi:zinc protease